MTVHPPPPRQGDGARKRPQLEDCGSFLAKLQYIVVATGFQTPVLRIANLRTLALLSVFLYTETMPKIT